MSKPKKVLFTFPDDETYTSDIIRDSYQFQEVFHNKLKTVDGECSFKIPFSIEVADMLKSKINLGKVKVTVKDEDDNNLNTYYIKEQFQFDKTQKNQPISINAISPSFFLDETLPRSVVMISKTVTEVIINLLKEIKYTDIGTIEIYNRLPYFVASEGDKVKDIVNELLYEYGYVAYFDADGKFNARPLFGDIPSNLAEIDQHFDGSNLREKITITAIAHEADYVDASYNKVEFFSNTLLFSDTQNATEQDKCKIEIEPYYWMFASSEEMKELLTEGKAKENLLNYDSTLGEVLYVSGIRADVSFDTGIKYNISRLDEEGNDLLTQCRLSAYNNSSVKRYCRKLDIYGDAFIATSFDSVVSSTGTKVKEVELKYITDKSTAEKFAMNVADYYRWANFDITAKSYVDYPLGSYVSVTDYGIGTYYGRIISKKRTLKNDCIEYKIETIADYEPAQIDKSKSERSGNVNAASGSKGATGEIGASGIFVFMEQSSAAFAVDQNERAEEYTLIVPIHCLCNGMEMPFKIAPIVQPYGMEVTDYEDDEGHYLKIHVLKDAVIGKGSFNVPIIYTEVNRVLIYGGSEYALGNHNKVAYGQYLFDDDSVATFNLVFTYQSSRMGIYRGGMDSLEKFLDPEKMEEYQLHRGDWFTWVGLDDSGGVEYNGITVNFKPAKVYYWNGLYWEEDNNAEHNATALSDVLSTAGEAIKNNNSDVNLMLNRLVSNQIFVDQLVASNAFVNALFARNIMISSGGWIQSEGFDGKTTGFRLNANGTFECKNGIFNGAINSGPLQLNRTSAGEFVLSKTIGTSFYDIFTELQNNGVFEGTYNVSGTFNGAGAARITFSSSVTTTYRTINYIKKHYATKRGMSNKSDTWHGGPYIWVQHYIYDAYNEVKKVYTYTVSTNSGTWTGKRTVVTLTVTKDNDYYEEPSNAVYIEPQESETIEGLTVGKTDLTFGADTMTFRLLNLPNSKLSTLPVGTVYQENGILKIVT